MSYAHLDLPRQYSRAQYKGAGGEDAMQRKRWEDNTREWTGLKLSEALRKTQDRNGWRKLTAKAMVSPLYGQLHYGIGEVRWGKPTSMSFTHLYRQVSEAPTKY